MTQIPDVEGDESGILLRSPHLYKLGFWYSKPVEEDTYKILVLLRYKDGINPFGQRKDTNEKPEGQRIQIDLYKTIFWLETKNK